MEASEVWERVHGAFDLAYTHEKAHAGATAIIEQAKAAWITEGMERAAAVLEQNAKLCDCLALEANECNCGAWDDYKTIPVARAVELIRAAKGRQP